jgi:hypothetical protein
MGVEFSSNLPDDVIAIQPSMMEGIDHHEIKRDDNLGSSFAALGLGLKDLEGLSGSRIAKTLAQRKMASQAEINAGRADPNGVTPSTARRNLMDRFGLNNVRYGSQY